MSDENRLTFGKETRLCNKRRIDGLFECGDSVSAFPVRIVYRIDDEISESSRILVMFSVSKKRFKHAVCRNRVKRQLREMYRRSVPVISEAMKERTGKQLLLAFVFCDSRLWDSAHLNLRFTSAIAKLTDRICEPDNAAVIVKRDGNGSEFV